MISALAVTSGYFSRHLASSASSARCSASGGSSRVPNADRDRACVTTSRALRSAASSNAKPSAAADSAGSCTPTTISRCTAMVSSRTTTTGQVAWVAAYRLTEPRISALNPPAPREPSTSIRASCPQSTRALAGAVCSISLVSMATPEAAPAAWLAAADSASVAAASMWPATVSWVAGFGLIRGGIDAMDTMRSEVRRNAASRAAHCTACTDSGEPSAPATTGFVAMPVLLKPGQSWCS